MKTRRTISLFARGLGSGLPLIAPTRLLLWAPGPVRGDFPPNVWDPEAARSVMANYLERAGGDPAKAFIPLDIEHATNPQANPLYDPAKPPPGGGYAGLQLDPRGALWLDPIEWSAYARAEIESGSRRAISPDWDFDPSTGRPVRLKKVALVQNPGTYGIGLVASAGANGGLKMDLSMFLAALEAALTADDPKAAIQALVDNVKALSSGGPGPASEAAPIDATAAPGCAPGDKKDMMAMAAAILATLKGAKPATASAAPIAKALTEADVAAIVTRTHREEKAKDALIAGAAQSPAMTEALATQLGALPLVTVKAIVGALPKPEPKSQATAGAAAGAAQAQGVKLDPLPGHAAATASAAGEDSLTAAEKRDIEIIERAAMTDTQRAAAFQKEKALLAGAGVGLFSGAEKVKQAHEALYGKGTN